MDAHHIHLLLNHVPVLGTIFGALLLAGAMWRRHGDVLRVALTFFVVSGLVAVPVYLTGEEAEEVVEERVGDAVIHEHEEAAEVAIWAVVALGVVALVGLFLSRSQPPKWLAPTVLVLALAVSGVMAWTANLGGQISHPELRDGIVQTSAPDADDEDAGVRERDDDD